MQKIYNIYIDTYRDNSVLKTNAEFVQGDADTNKFIIHLSQRREPFNLSGLTATITIKKADDEVIVGLCSIVDAEKGIIEYELGTNDISYPGYCRATVEVYEGEARLTSNIFSFDVREQLDDGESIESTTEYSVLQSLISDIQDIEAVGEGSGDMLASVYDPDTKESDVFDSSNHDYDNTISGLTATNTKSAIDELQDSKVTKVEGKGLSTEDYTTLEKNKLAGIDNNANNYTHPATHPPSIIDEDENNRFVTDAEKDRWDNVAQTSATGNITVNLDSNRHYSRTGISGTISISEPSGTPQLGDKLLFTLKDNGTARTLSWDAVYKNGFGQELPATTVAGKQHIVGFMYVGNEWQCVAALEEE